MSIIKSLSVGNGDMFYIKHGSDNISIIDCCLDESSKARIVNEIIAGSKGKGISRFISTHPDEDHVRGLTYLDSYISIVNFYCVKNEATKKDASTDFKKCCEFRDSDKAFYLEKGCSRKWMNKDGDGRGSSGIDILWPITSNDGFKEALQISKDGGSPNNISPIIKYSLNRGVTALWMGDLETEFLISIEPDLDLPKVDILFAPHHGRDSAKIPEEYLQILDPKIVIIGEAPSQHLNYYKNYNTITQNTAGDITFDCEKGEIDIYVSNKNYSVNFLANENKTAFNYYLGTLNL